MNNKILKKLFIVSMVAFGLFLVFNNINNNVANSCTITSWSPATSTVCSGTSFTQKNNCGTTRTATGTKSCSSSSSSSGCTITSWSPAASTVCSGTSFTQKNNCGTTRTATGTKSCSSSGSSSSYSYTGSVSVITIDCDKYDGWVYTGKYQYVYYDHCREVKQLQKVYYDYYSSGNSCSYSLNNYEWENTSTYRYTSNCNDYCGDGVCNNGETRYSCPTDCGYCGDGVCNNGETRYTCSSDCGYCGNGVCDNGETQYSCPNDCGGYCGDGTCNNNETKYTCPTDCGYCGDGICNNGETKYTCSSDCGYLNCNIYDKTEYTGETRYVDYGYCQQRLQRRKVTYDYYLSGNSCIYNTDYSWENTSTIINKTNCGSTVDCNIYDEYFYTGRTQYVDYGNCQQILQREQTFRDYYSSGSTCLYVDSTSWKNTGTVITKSECSVPTTISLSNLVTNKEVDSCSYEITPIKLSWSVTSGSQAYYQLQIAKDSSFSDVLVDTGKFKSTNQSYTFNPGEESLNYWRVRIWDNSGNVSSWVTGNSFNSTTYAEYNSQCNQSILYYIIPETVKTNKGNKDYDPLPGISVVQTSGDIVRMLFTVENTGDYTNRPVKLKIEVYDDDNPALLSTIISDETYIFSNNEQKDFNPIIYSGSQSEGRYLVNISIVDANDTDEKLSNVVHAKYSVDSKMTASLLSVFGENIPWILGAGFLLFLFLIFLSKRKK